MGKIMKRLVTNLILCMLLISLFIPMISAQPNLATRKNNNSERIIEVLSDDLLRIIEPFDPELLKSSEPGPGYYDTSEYMIGSVAVGVIFLESNGLIDPSTEDWTPAEEANVQNEINQGLTWWAIQNNNAGVSFTLDIHLGVPTSYEPIIHPSAITNDAMTKLWVSEALGHLGYTTGDWMQRTRDYINAIRTTYNTDWAYTVFVVDSSADIDGCFSDGFCAFAYLGGPLTVMTYDNNGWGIGAMDQVFAHETGHIFWATDEYDGTTEYSGYLNAADVEGSGCLMDTNALILSSGTKLQIGWRDTDMDNIPDIIDTYPETTLTPYSPNPTSNPILTYTGSATVVPYQNQNPQPHNPGNDVTINYIAIVNFRINSGTYIGAPPVDGVYDEPVEDYTFTTNPLPPGYPHLIEAMAVNNVGNADPTPATDTIVIDNPPDDPAITGATQGNTGEQYDYTLSTNDPDGDPVYFWVDWGDSTNTGWVGPFPSGTQTIEKHTWSTDDTYTIQVKAKDTWNMESGWTTLEVTMPKNVFVRQSVIYKLNQFPIIDFLLSLLK